MSPATPAPFQPGSVQDANGATTTPLPVVPKVKKERKSIPSQSNEVLGAKVTILFKDETGQEHEASVAVSEKDFIVQHHSLEQKKMFRKINEEDGSCSFEDTGERTLTFKLRYHVK